MGFYFLMKCPKELFKIYYFKYLITVVVFNDIMLLKDYEEVICLTYYQCLNILFLFYQTLIGKYLN